MNYCEEIIEEIKECMAKKNYEEAKRLIENELAMPYVPREIEEKLYEYKGIADRETYIAKQMSDEEIEEYLKGNEYSQLVAVEELNRKNLRDYIQLCSSYLDKDGFKNAECLLIDSLVRQEINHEFIYEGMFFNPSKLRPFEESEGYIVGKKHLEDVFMKDPSMLKLSIELFINAMMLSYPKNLDGDEGLIMSDKVKDYVLKAFDSAN